jgi:hypothetical protein
MAGQEPGWLLKPAPVAAVLPRVNAAWGGVRILMKRKRKIAFAFRPA